MKNPGNYIPDVNRFALAGPPLDFQIKLYHFDPSLVIVPSRMGFYYRLAQRRKPALVDKVAYEALREQADTAMLMSYNLVPVTTILATANWSNPILFHELANRAPWRMGGAKKVIADLEAHEAAQELEKRKQTDENLTDLAKDAWKYYGKKIGIRSSLYSPKTSAPKAQKPTGLIIPGAPTPRPDVKVSWGR